MKILVLGNSGLNNSNNSTNNRMKRIFELLNQKYGYIFDYYKLRNATLEVDYIRYLNTKSNNNPKHVIKEILLSNVKYDLIIAETFNAAIIAYFVSKFHKSFFIWRQFGTTFNDDLDFNYYIKPKNIIKLFLYRIIANSNNCKAIVCTEDGCANRTLFLNKLNVSVNKFFLVKNQRTENVNLKKIDYKEREIFNLVQIGRINSWKKIHIVIDALIDIKKERPEIFKLIQFKIIGIIDDKDYQISLMSKINRYELGKNVSIKQNLEYNQIEEELQNAHLSISLTAYNPIIESLQNEVPVITYEYGEVNDIFNNCEAVFVLAKDIKKSTNLLDSEESKIRRELKDKLIALFYKRKELFDLGREGRKFVESEFPTLEEHSEEIIDIYQKVIDAIQ